MNEEYIFNSNKVCQNPSKIIVAEVGFDKSEFCRTVVNYAYYNGLWFYATTICSYTHYSGSGVCVDGEFQKGFNSKNLAIEAALKEIIKDANGWLKNQPSNEEIPGCKTIINNAKKQLEKLIKLSLF